jgi:HEAT repeat protein
MSDKSEGVVAAAITGLGKLSDQGLVPLLAAPLASDKRVMVRKSAAYALGRFKIPDSTAALLGALRDKDLEVRGAAVVALGEHEDPAVIQPLIQALSDDSAFVREQAARSLGRRGRASASAVPALTRRLESDDATSVRLHAAEALGQIGDRSALPSLERASHDPNPYLSKAALASIKLIARQD